MCHLCYHLHAASSRTHADFKPAQLSIITRDSNDKEQQCYPVNLQKYSSATPEAVVGPRNSTHCMCATYRQLSYVACACVQFDLM